MDACKTFETRSTARLARLEWGALLVVCVVLLVANVSAVHWPVFVGLFITIDAIGYLRGMIAYRRSTTGAVPKAYCVLYNTMHCLTTCWATRALFGNSLEPFVVSFEPQTHPAFAEFRRRYAAAPALWQAPAPEPERAEGEHVAA